MFISFQFEKPWNV